MVYKIMKNEDFFKENIFYSVTGRVFAILLAIFSSCFLFVSLIFPSFKDTESGYDGFADGYYYTYAEDSSGVVLEECREELSGDIVIPAIVGGKKVAGLGQNLFASNDKITGVIISEGIKEISFRSFYDCNQLKAVSIPNSVIEVRDEAFEGCSNLEYYEKDGAYYLGNEINHYIYLAKVSQSASISIENGCKFIAESSFYRSSIKSIVIPNTVISIGRLAFNACEYLESVTLQNGLKDIRFKAFANCDSLKGKTIVIPNSVEYIDDFIFYNSRLTIYCEAESEPDRWAMYWDYYSDNWKDVFSSHRCTVVWGYKGE